ncbi:hypothetical protein BDV18DRAFT_70288 [Aspergillus unguis]
MTASRESSPLRMSTTMRFPSRADCQCTFQMREQGTSITRRQFSLSILPPVSSLYFGII